MERFARLVMHHRRMVSAFWLLMFVGGLLSAGQLGSRWAFDFSLPGQAGDRAGQQVTDTYGVSAADTYVALVTVPRARRSPSSPTPWTGCSPPRWRRSRT